MDESLFTLFSSQRQEMDLPDLVVEGQIPQWLQGDFISNGPAQFEVGKHALTHWFDGFAMLKKFSFSNGKVSFQNRFLKSRQFVQSNALGHLQDNEFATYASSSFLGKMALDIKNLFHGLKYDNCNVNIVKIGSEWIAATETNHVIEFKPENLSTLGEFIFEDALKGQLMLAHPQFDIERKELINVLTEFGKKTQYHIFKISQNSKKREIIKTLTSDKAFYSHSFSITKNYVILLKSPLLMNKWKLMFGAPFKNSLYWQENMPSTFLIIDRQNGEISEIETNPFLYLHSANAFEHGNEIILDLICYDKGDPYDFFYLDNLRSSNAKFPRPSLRRFILNLENKKVKIEILNQDSPEFPRINYLKKNGGNYDYLYTTAMSSPTESFFNQIQKIDMKVENTWKFERLDYYFGEAIFVAKPQCIEEDDGIVLSTAYNKNTKCSSLFILNAKNLEFLAEIKLPFHLPAGLHGNFYQG